MKKALLLLPLVLSGCIQPQETIRNPKCNKIGQLEIIQLDKDVSLTSALFYDNGYNYQGGWRKEDVAVKTKDFDIWKGDKYDGQKLGFSEKLCATEDGTYSYTTVTGAQKTIRKMKFIDSQVPNPEYKEWKADQDKKQKEQSKS